MPYKNKAQRRAINAKKKRDAHKVVKHAYFEGRLQALTKLGLDADAFAEFAEADDTADSLPGAHNPDELEEENPWLANNQELVNPSSPWAGATQVTSDRSADF